MFKNYINIFLFFLLIKLSTQVVYAEINSFKVDRNNINSLITKKVKDPFLYTGLASFYNDVNLYIIDDNGIKKVDSGKLYTMQQSQYLAIIGHYKILIVTNINHTLSFTKNKLIWHEGNYKENFNARILLKSELSQMHERFQQLKFVDLWEPLRLLCIGMEIFLIWLYSVHDFGWGINIILISLIFRIVTLPTNILLIRMQRKISYIQVYLNPELKKIKKNFSGEECHKKLMAAYKRQNITPFYTLKPLLITLIPFPFLIAIFNVLGEGDLITEQSFLWIKNLARPDAVFSFDIYFPLFGNSINLLPILMMIVSILATILHQNKIICVKEIYKEKINLFLMAIIFFILFYPFPSAMVLFWVFTNIWQLIIQRFVRI